MLFQSKPLLLYLSLSCGLCDWLPSHAEKAHLRYLLWNSEFPDTPLYVNPSLILLLIFGKEVSAESTAMCVQILESDLDGTFLNSDKPWAAWTKRPNPSTSAPKDGGGFKLSPAEAAAARQTGNLADALNPQLQNLNLNGQQSNGHAAAATASTAASTPSPAQTARTPNRPTPTWMPPEVAANPQNWIPVYAPVPSSSAHSTTGSSTPAPTQVPSRVRSTPREPPVSSSSRTRPSSIPRQENPLDLPDEFVHAKVPDDNMVTLPGAVVELSDLQKQGCVACGAMQTREGERLLCCSGCLGVFYCCQEHQRQDWKTHKKVFADWAGLLACHP